MKLLANSYFNELNLSHIFFVLNKSRYVLSCALFGFLEIDTKKFMCFNGFTPLSKTDFYICQKIWIEKIQKLARAKINEFQKNIKGSFFIRLDGSWSTRRNATHWLAEFIAEARSLITILYLSRLRNDFTCHKNGFTDKWWHLISLVKLDEKFLGPSNMMENFFNCTIVEEMKREF